MKKFLFMLLSTICVIALSSCESANHFYNSFKEIELEESPTLRKNLD